MKSKSTESPRYSTLRNTLWMIQNAWTYKKFVLFVTVTMAAITVSDVYKRQGLHFLFKSPIINSESYQKG